MKALRPLSAWLLTLVYLVLRFTCRVRRHRDPRPAFRARAQPYIYSVLHAHNIATLLNGEQRTAALVSHSGDGALIVHSLRLAGGIPIRGSSDRDGRDRGGRTAFRALVRHVAGGDPAYLPVDGPRGPRNHVQGGVALLSMKTGAPVVNVCAVPTRRWILSRTWDRMQVPKPFSTIDVYFGEPMYPQPGEKPGQFRERIEAELNALEREHDPAEARLGQAATDKMPLQTAAA